MICGFVTSFRRVSWMVSLAVLLIINVPVAGKTQTPEAAFVKADGAEFVLLGRPYFVAGINNHYLTYGSDEEVRHVLDDAVAMGANVVRTFIQPVIGSLDGSVPTIWDWQKQGETANLSVHGNYMLYWDTVRSEMVINPGANGVQRVDFLIAEAKKRHLKLIIAFLDFWRYTGGAHQMAAWYDSSDVRTFFFEDPRIRADYRMWVSYILHRVNSITGVEYRNDPTIFAWELMNEPESRPRSLLDRWIAEMAGFVKSIDGNHMLSSGQANVSDRLSDIAIPNLDFAEWHGYPIFYRLTPAQFTSRIEEFCGLAKERKRPVLLEEFGYARSNADQVDVYRTWLQTIRDNPDCSGWMFWRLVSRQDDGRYPADEHEQFDIHRDGGHLWSVVTTAAAQIRAKTDSLDVRNGESH
jgi:mannan endo-1,4-beta-mannosidase